MVGAAEVINLVEPVLADVNLSVRICDLVDDIQSRFPRPLTAPNAGVKGTRIGTILVPLE